MPPKKPIGISELKKQLAKEKKKKEKQEEKERTKPVKPRVPATTTAQARQVRIRAKEEDARRKFFERILKQRGTLSDEELLTEMKVFGTDPEGQLFRSDFIKRLGQKLSASLIYDYAQGYLSQMGTSTEYLNKFLSDPDIILRIEMIAELSGKKYKKYEDIPEEAEYEGVPGEEEEEEEEEEVDVEELASDLEKFLIEEEEETIRYEPIKGPRGSIKYVKDIESMEEVKVRERIPLKYKKDFDEKCMQWYRLTPWLPDRAQYIWIRIINWGEGQEFYHEDDSILIDDEIYYRANKNFITAQCNFFRNQRSQDGDIFTFYTQEGNKIEAQVIFELPKEKFIPQTEEIFQKEVNMYFELSAPLEKRVRTLLKRTVNMLSISEKKSLKEVMYTKMSEMLSALKYTDKSSGERIERVMYSKMVSALSKNVVDIFFLKESDESIKILLEKFSLYLSYFDSYLYTYSKTFTERLILGAYEAEELINITPVEVSPEIYLDPRVDKKDRDVFTRYLSVTASDIYIHLAYNFYYEIYPRQRKVVIPTVSSIDPKVRIGEGGIRSLCANIDQIPANISPHNLYVYQDEDGKFYCFDLSDLPEELEIFGENPETKNPLPDSVFEEIVKLSNRLKVETEVLPRTVEEEKEEEEKMAPGFLRIVIEDVMELEDELGIKGRDLLSQLKKYEVREEAGVEGSSEKVSKTTEKIESICGYCQKHLRDPSIFSSIVQGKGGSKLIDFCNLECFEKMEKWPRVKKRQEKLEKKYEVKLEENVKERKTESSKYKPPCWNPPNCESNPMYTNADIREIAESCGDIPTKTSRGTRIRKNICADLAKKFVEKESEEREGEKSVCTKCERNILSGEEMTLGDQIMCKRCSQMQSIPLVKEIVKKEAKMASEKDKICAKCEKFMGDNPAWRSTDLGHGVVHYCSLKCFQDYDPDTTPTVKQAKDIEAERKEQLSKILRGTKKEEKRESLEEILESMKK